MVDPEVAGREEAQAALSLALPSLSEAAGFEVSGEVGCADPLAAIQDALAGGSFDEIVVSTLPHRFSRWLRLDLPSKARGLGLPVAHVEAETVPEPRGPQLAGLTRRSNQPGRSGSSSPDRPGSPSCARSSSRPPTICTIDIQEAQASAWHLLRELMEEEA